MNGLTDQSFREAGPPKKFDQTMLFGYASSCWRKLYWFLRGLDYSQKPPYFITGQAFQEGLDGWYSEKSAKVAQERGRKVWERSRAIPAFNDTPEVTALLLDMYALSYPKENFEVIVLEQGGKKSTELGFVFPLRDSGYSLAGAIDGYLDWSPYGRMVLENKTTSTYLNDKYIQQWSLHPQPTTYIWALNQMVDNVYGCLMNMASKRLTQGAIRTFRESFLVPEGTFARTLETRSAFALKEFEETCLGIIEDIEAHWRRWVWPKTGNVIECVGGIGKSPCPYLALCREDYYPWEIDDPVDMSRGFLRWREKAWAPWERGGEEG